MSSVFQSCQSDVDAVGNTPEETDSAYPEFPTSSKSFMCMTGNSFMLSDAVWRMWPFHQTRRQSIAPSQDWTHDHLSAQHLPVNVRVRYIQLLCLLSAPDCIIAGLPIEYWCTLPPFCTRLHHRRPANQVLMHSASFLHRTASLQTCQSSTDAIGCVLSLCRFSRLMCHQQDSSCLRTVWVGSPQPFGWDWSL